jgi:hypothetical protein
VIVCVLNTLHYTSLHCAQEMLRQEAAAEAAAQEKSAREEEEAQLAVQRTAEEVYVYEREFVSECMCVYRCTTVVCSVLQ